MTEACRTALRSDASIVGVEAAAGCGKTFEAAALAVDLAQGLQAGQEVLLLAHTHAAINVFRQRVASRERVRVMTLDAFAHELIAPYARGLGLPVPLAVGRDGGLPFAALAPTLRTLLSRAPVLKRHIATHYPVILLDEHQDARLDQHEAAIELARAGSRVRFFGDPMQAIFNFGDDGAADWSRLVGDAEHMETLATPRRWPQAPALGEWLTAARSALLAGSRLPNPPQEVAIETVDEREPPPVSNVAPATLATRIFRLLNTLEGSIGLLVRTRAHAVGLRRALGRRIPIFEGRLALERAGKLLDRVAPLVGNPQSLAVLALEALAGASAGLTTAICGQIAGCLKADGIERKRQKKWLPLLEVLSRLYEQPAATTWCSVVGALAAQPPPDVQLDDARALFVLGSLNASHDEELQPSLAELAQTLSHRRPRGRCITTIHMAKGDEFDHVIIPHFGSRTFPGSVDGRKLLYVATTRARRTVHLLAPRETPSPLAPNAA